MPTAELDNAGVVAVLTKANLGEIAEGKLASTKAGDAEVKAFGQHMVTEHTNAQALLTTIAQNASITPEENPLSRLLDNQSSLTLAHLAGLSGEAFDRAYLEGQVMTHQAVLTLIDLTLLPSTTAAPLRVHLLDMRTHIAQHQQEAQALLDDL